MDTNIISNVIIMEQLPNDALWSSYTKKCGNWRFATDARNSCGKGKYTMWGEFRI